MFDLSDLANKRCQQVRAAMITAQLPALLVLDPVNIFYATGARNMSVFAMRVPSRYLMMFAEGPTILFEYTGCEHLAKGLPTIDQIRPARGLCYVSSGNNTEEAARGLASEIADLYREYTSADTSLAIDRFPLTVTDALRDQGFLLSDADPVFARARKVKMPEEIEVMREGVRRVESAVDVFRTSLLPGRSESEAWSEFHRPFIATEGQYVTTRLMQSGEHTFPYFQECASRTIESGDLVCLDTDALGFGGYAVDFSRTFICGDKAPTARQRELYQRAKDQLEWNSSLIKPGITFEEIGNKAWPVPHEHQASRYYCVAHGLGMSGEFPNIAHATKGEPYPIDGLVESGMVLCVESYIGCERTGQGVKLEDQFVVTQNGADAMSRYPLDDQFLNREI
ncbi:MAG: Xaa-Pro peptidase family protein [Pseudomonadota bacterium]